MCLIVLGKQIPSNHIRNGWEYGNDDGAGYAFAVNGKLTVRKPYWSLDKLLKALSADQAKHPDSTFLIHLRMTTHGTDCVENLHPMLLDNGCVIAHNGILRGFNPSDGRSDTRMFADTVLASRSRRQLMGKSFADQLGHMIGTNNKLVFLDSDGRYSIVNEHLGVWFDGRWYSNQSYIAETVNFGDELVSICSDCGGWISTQDTRRIDGEDCCSECFEYYVRMSFK